jgi:hypothetical protein
MGKKTEDYVICNTLLLYSCLALFDYRLELGGEIHEFGIQHEFQQKAEHKRRKKENHDCDEPVQINIKPILELRHALRHLSQTMTMENSRKILGKIILATDNGIITEGAELFDFLEDLRGKKVREGCLYSVASSS